MKKTNVLKSAAIAALFSLLTLVGCNNAAGNGAGGANYTTSGQIFGYVTDTKGEPLSGVTIALGDKTTTTNDAGAFALTGVPVNATQADSGVTYATATTQTYTLTAKKDGYLSKTVDKIAVVETTDKSDDAILLKAATEAYQKILEEFAKQGAAGTTAITASTSSAVATDGVLMNTQNTNDTYKGMADAYASVLDRYQNLSKTYESTFVTMKLTPCNAYVEGTLKITKSPQKNITTDASSIKAAPADVKVKLTTSDGYVYEARTDNAGKFKFEKLPVNTDLTLKVEGFEATYESGEGENKVVETYYYSLINGAGASASLWCGDELQENKNTFKLEENSGAKYKADILLYSQPAKIIVTDTNLLQNTKVAPLALNTAITVTFNKPMDYVELVSATKTQAGESTVTNVDDLGAKASYAWKDNTVTITPKDGYWTASKKDVTFQLKGRAKDGATEFIDNVFDVTLDNVIKATFKDTSSATEDSFTLTFDRELINTSAVTVKDDQSEAVTLAWDLTTNVAAPVLTVKARDGKFAKFGEHTFIVSSVEAKDSSKEIHSYEREFGKYTAAAGTTPQNATFKVRFDGFKATSIEVVDKFEGSLSRAVVATTAQYLKITFNKNVSDVSGLTLKDSATTQNTAKYKYVKDNAVYISLADFEDNKSLTLSGAVISTSGDKFDGTGDIKWTDLLTDYTVRTAYVIAASNLYVEKNSINTNNDNSTAAIKLGDKVTLTFNKDIPANATFETELYRSDSLVKLDQTAYSATATASGKVVTVTLNGNIETGKKYYLSLKIKSADGAELFSTGSKSFATGSYAKDIYVEGKISATVSEKKYIEINILDVELIPEGSSKTTKAEEFKKSSNAPVVLQFNQDVTGYTAYLYDSIFYATLKTRTLEDLSVSDKSNFYTSTFAVAGDTITITPTYSFQSNKTIGVAVFNKEGKFVELKKDGNNNVAFTLTTKSFETKRNPDNAVKAIANFKAKDAKLDNNALPEFTFDMLVLNKYKQEVPKFYLYKKADEGYDTSVSADTIEWKLVGAAEQTVNPDGKTNTYNWTNYRTDKSTAYIKASEGVNLTYANTETFILVAVQDNMVVKSDEVVITKK